MTDNVIHLPRPRQLRTGGEPLAFFVRVGRNDHKEILEMIAAGERGIFGIVIEAPFADRHKELITEARKRSLDVILDPKTQQMALQGRYNEALIGLPWGKSEKHHSLVDFEGAAGETRSKQIVDFALAYGFTQILGPTHLIDDPNDPWLQRDIAVMRLTEEQIARTGKKLNLIYSLAVPIALFRDDERRSAIVDAISGAAFDSVWLKIENFGDNATGEKTAAYIKACRDFHSYGLPIVADYVGGLPGLGSLAFGAVGGIAHGVTISQNFSASSWRRPPSKGGGSTERRVYLPQLDMLVKPDDTRQFLGSSQHIRGRHVCRDPRCCPRGLTDMFDRPARHAIYQRAREIEKLGEIPRSVRVATYLDHVRRVSDEVAHASGLDKVDAEFKKKLREKQKGLGHFRDAIAHLATTSSGESVALAPLRHDRPA